MTTTTLTADLIARLWTAAAPARRAFNAHMAQRPEGVCRAAWANEAPAGVTETVTLPLIDTAMKSPKARRCTLSMPAGGDVWVWAGTKLRARISLKVPAEAAQLSRFQVEA